MKIEVGGLYQHKATGRKVIVNRIENKRVYFPNRGIPGTGSTSVFDFGIKYKKIK